MGTLMNWNLEVYFCTQAVFKGADCISLKQQLLDNGKENWSSSSSNETGEMLIRLGGVECKDIIELVKNFPALQVVAFLDYFGWNKKRYTYIVYSESYYEEFTEWREIGACDGQSDLPFSEEVDILSESEETYRGTYSYDGKNFSITYSFPFKQEWSRRIEEEKVDVPNSEEETTISDSAFENNDRLINVEILDHVKKIGKKAFCSCKYLKTIIIPNGIKKINDLTFSSCRNLRNVVIPNTVSDIGNSAFKECHSLVNIKLPINLKKIGSSAFSSCLNLTEVIFPIGITKIGKNAFRFCNCISEIEIPGSVQSIEEGAFSYCSGLKKVVIKEGVECIAPKAFAHCSSLESITLPFSIIKIDSHVFDECISLKSIVVPNPNAIIDESIKNNSMIVRMQLDRKS